METKPVFTVKKKYYLILFLICFLIRFLLSGFFAFYKDWFLCGWNAISFSFYGFLFIYTHKKSPDKNMLYLFQLEVLLSTICHNLRLGWGFGFSLYSVAMIVSFFYLRYQEDDTDKLVFPIVRQAIIIYLVTMLSSFINHQYNKTSISNDILACIHFINLMICIGAIIVVCAMFFYLAKHMQENLKDSNNELKKMAYYDPVTECYNRNGFYEVAYEIIHQNKDMQYAIILSDIKDFKLINDIFGYEVGDKVLQTQAKLINAYLTKKSVLGRLGGDKFALLMPKANFHAEQFEANISQMRRTYSTNRYQLHMHLGVYVIEDIEEPIGKMCDKAAYAISTIKDDRSKILAYYDQDILHNQLRKQQLLNELDQALDKEQIKMYLQPQTTCDGKLLGAEALVRWEHPEFGMIPPGEFIEYFENSGVIYKLDMYIWEKAAEKIKEWSDRGIDAYISVNISQKDFYYIDVKQAIFNISEMYGINKNRLRLEITESTFSEDQDEIKDAISKLHEKGFLIEIDDFGSGYSSLRFLKDVDADVLKIDRGFIQETSNATDINRGQNILKSVIQLSKEINMNVIAEGVETKNQVDLVHEMGCNCFQGFYFSKPIPVDEFENMYF